MAAFASNTDLANWLQTSVNTDAATLALAVASSAIRTYCNWTISQETVTESLDGTGSRYIWLPTLKLTAVASVTVSGHVLVAGTDYDWTAYGKLIRNGCWPRTARSVVIVYTHGYAAVPEAVKGVCLAIAARAYSNPQSARSNSESMGPFTRGLTFADGGPAAGVSTAEREVLGPFKLEHVG